MIIQEICPECGGDLLSEVICTYPPIPKKVCSKCGWTWTGKPEKIERVVFNGKELEQIGQTKFKSARCFKEDEVDIETADGILSLREYIKTVVSEIEKESRKSGCTVNILPDGIPDVPTSLTDISTQDCIATDIITAHSGVEV